MKSDVSSCSTEHPTCVMPAPIPRLEASPDVEEQRLVVYLPADASGTATCSTGRYAGPQSSKTRDVERCAPRGARLCQREDESTCPTAPFCPTGLLQPVLCQTGRTTKNDEISNRDEGFHISSCGKKSRNGQNSRNPTRNSRDGTEQEGGSPTRNRMPAAN